MFHLSYVSYPMLRLIFLFHLLTEHTVACKVSYKGLQRKTDLTYYYDYERF